MQSLTLKQVFLGVTKSRPNGKISALWKGPNTYVLCIELCFTVVCGGSLFAVVLLLYFCCLRWFRRVGWGRFGWSQDPQPRLAIQSGPVTNSILSCCLYTIKDQCKNSGFYKDTITVLLRFFLTVTSDNPTWDTWRCPCISREGAVSAH